MRIRWRGLELPSRVSVDRDTLTDIYGKFSIEPFVRGFGTTLGNSLRRVLLSSIEGTAVTTVRFDKVLHEFSTIPGVVEDVTDIILNLKGLRARLYEDDTASFRLEARKKGEVRASQIDTRGKGEIVNPDLLVATLAEDALFSVEMDIERGRGYRTADEHAREDGELGTIPIDAIFSPVRRVRFHTEETRVGKLTNYDRLVMEIWTDGTITAEMALVEAGKILRKHLNPFVQYFEQGPELPLLDISSAPAPPAPAPSEGAAPSASAHVEPHLAAEGAPSTADAEALAALPEEIREKLQWSVMQLQLGERASKCLEDAGIRSVRELVDRREDQLLHLENLGQTTLNEIKRKLEEQGLTLGMHLEAVSKSTEGSKS